LATNIGEALPIIPPSLVHAGVKGLTARSVPSLSQPTAGSISVESDPCRSLGFVREDTVNRIGGAFGRCVVVVRVPL
jgi:hypothetical protein